MQKGVGDRKDHSVQGKEGCDHDGMEWDGGGWVKLLLYDD